MVKQGPGRPQSSLCEFRAGGSTEKLAKPLGMKLSGGVHSLKIATETGFEGNLTLRFGHRIFFIYFWMPPEQRETTTIGAQIPFFHPKALGLNKIR